MTGKQRLGYFLIGATFSCILMGFYVSYRAKVRDQLRQEAAARDVGRPLPVPGVPLNPEKK